MNRCTVLESAESLQGLDLAYVDARVPAGFPSPADDYLEKVLNLGELLAPRPASTFIMRVEGDSMQGAQIFDGDLIVVDRSVEPANRRIVVAIIDAEFVVKRLAVRGDRCFLVSENPRYAEIEVGEWSSLEIWGVVMHVIHSVR